MRTPALTPEGFWQRVERTVGCWLWLAEIDGSGYGRVRVGKLLGKRLGLDPRKSFKAHRVAWTLAHGPIPDGMLVLHRCDTPRCVRPSHLFLGTQADNMADMATKGRWDHARRRQLPRGPNHWTRRYPERVARGDRAAYRRHPEAYPKGEQRWNAKLSAGQVAEMRRRYEAGGVSQPELAREYGIRQSTVWGILHRRTWAHVA